MCAIAGVIALPCTDEIGERMLSTMTRRGPDAVGNYQNAFCRLFHARLTVIDPEGGKQPMHLKWAQEGYTIVYNGELYNTEELRTALLREGHSFQGHSDTEVLLHAYAQWGAECLEKCNGIFAFGVWESTFNPRPSTMTAYPPFKWQPPRLATAYPSPCPTARRGS